MSNKKTTSVDASSVNGKGNKYKFSFSYPDDEKIFAPEIVKNLEAIIKLQKNKKKLFLIYSYNNDSETKSILSQDTSCDDIVFKKDDPKFPVIEYAKVCFQEHSLAWQDEITKYINKEKRNNANKINYYFSMSGGKYPLDSKIMRWGLSFRTYIDVFSLYCLTCLEKVKKQKIYFIECSSGNLSDNSRKEIYDLVQEKKCQLNLCWEYYTYFFKEADKRNKLVKGYKYDEEETLKINREKDSLFIVFGHGEGYAEVLKKCLRKKNDVLTNVSFFDIKKHDNVFFKNLSQIKIIAPNNTLDGNFIVECANELFDFLCNACGKGNNDTREYFNNVISSSPIVKSNKYDFYYWREDGESIFPLYIYSVSNLWKFIKNRMNFYNIDIKLLLDSWQFETYCAKYNKDCCYKDIKLVTQRNKEFLIEIISNIQNQFLGLRFQDLDLSKANSLIDLLKEMLRNDKIIKGLKRIEDVLKNNFNAEPTLFWNPTGDDLLSFPSKHHFDEMSVLQHLILNFNANAWQINYCDYDLEDNNVLRFYIVEKGKIVSPLSILTLEKKNLENIVCIILAKSIEIAKWLYDNDDYYERKAKECFEAKKREYVRDFSGCLIKDQTSIKEILNIFLKKFFKQEGKYIQKYRFCYFISEKNTNVKTSFFSNGIFMYTEYKLSLFEIQILSEIATSFFAFINNSLSNLLRSYTNNKYAIGSIMSRNGSHNIGSHVLAALSHNIGTMPDDRVFYQYIQHRMDYIATVTTERPLWRQPTMFVSNMMKDFLKQTHLLEYISASEGLHAYKFQGQAFGKSQRRTICMHVRRIYDNSSSDWWANGRLDSDCENVANFIKYDKESVDFAKDVAVAIPGGVVGQHAFFTIIENVLRNAAKHEWSEAIRVWKIAQAELGDRYEDLLKDCDPKSLELYIDFHDNPTKGMIECCIWNNRVISVKKSSILWSHILINWLCSEKFEDRAKCLEVTGNLLLPIYHVLKAANYNLSYNKVFSLTDSLMTSKKVSKDNESELQNEICLKLESVTNINKEEYLQDFQDFLFQGMCLEGKGLKKKLEDKIKASFIDTTNGSLRKENWGIAEMRISAGFLRSSDIAQIGSLSEAKSALNIISPVLIKNQDGDDCIGYRFDIEKPKELLIVLDSHKNTFDEDTIEGINNESRQYGISFIVSDKIRKDKAYPYSYVLFEFLDKDMIGSLIRKEMAFPFRMLAKRIYENGEGVSRCRKFVPEYRGSFFEEIVDIIDVDCRERIFRNLLEEVYADWLRHVRDRYCDKNGRKIEADNYPKLLLDLENDGQGSGQTLISSPALLDFVYQNSFNTAVRSFLKTNGRNAETGVITESADGKKKKNHVVSLSESVAAALYALTLMPTRVADNMDEIAKKADCDTSEFIANEKEVVELQLEKWLREVFGEREYVNIESKRVDSLEIGDSWAICLTSGGASTSIHTGKFEEFCNDKINHYWLQRFCDYIATDILKQADSFLRKYEERFSTLPVNFIGGCGARKVKHNWTWMLHDKEKIQEICIERNEEARERAELNGDICYQRHGMKEIAEIGKQHYEPLSGAQGILNSFMAFKDNIGIVKAGNQGENIFLYADARLKATRFITELIENAMMRMLIIDERVARFMREHSEVRKIIGGLGIAVADDKEPQVIQLFTSDLSASVPVFSGLKITDFEIVIIHEGVVDKLLPGHEDKGIVEQWFNNLIEKLQYVVITTGRGAPTNIPNMARVIPYSIIESSILQRYPEKMILVGAVMNMLPMKTEVSNDSSNIHS